MAMGASGPPGLSAEIQNAIDTCSQQFFFDQAVAGREAKVSECLINTEHSILEYAAIRNQEKILLYLLGDKTSWKKYTHPILKKELLQILFRLFKNENIGCTQSIIKISTDSLKIDLSRIRYSKPPTLSFNNIKSVLHYSKPPTLSFNNIKSVLHFLVEAGPKNYADFFDILLDYPHMRETPSAWIDNLGNNLLHYACVFGHRQLAKYLIEELGISPFSRNKKGNTPFDLLQKKALTDIDFRNYAKDWEATYRGMLRFLSAGLENYHETKANHASKLPKALQQEICKFLMPTPGIREKKERKEEKEKIPVRTDLPPQRRSIG